MEENKEKEVWPQAFLDSSCISTRRSLDKQECVDSVDRRQVPRFGKYPEIPFNIDQDIRQVVLNACVGQIEDNFYAGRAHGADLVIDRDTAYYNASSLVGDDERLDQLLNSETMKLQLGYIKNSLSAEPYYRVKDKTLTRLNGIYMHGITIGNVLSISSVKKL